MSSKIVLPSLSTWAEQRLTALYQITNETDFDAAYAAFFTKNPKITVNGKTLSSDAYKKQLWSGKGLEQGAQVAYSGAVEVPDNTAKPLESGNVGLFLQATIDEKFLVFGAPETSTVTASYNLTIIQDPSAPKPPSVPVHGGDYDSRRVSVLTQVSVDKSNPIVPPFSPSQGINQPGQ